MATECVTQLTLGFQPKILLDFNGGEITSDTGLLLVRQFDAQLALTKKLNGIFTDWRRPAFIEHQTHEMLVQRIYQIAAGYEDCNDADTLRLDPTFQTVVGKSDPLASQPTLSRLENHADEQTIERLAAVGLQWVLHHGYQKDKRPKKSYWIVTPPTIPATASRSSPFFTANTASTCIIRCFSLTPKPTVCSRPCFARQRLGVSRDCG